MHGRPQGANPTIHGAALPRSSLYSRVSPLWASDVKTWASVLLPNYFFNVMYHTRTQISISVFVPRPQSR